MADDTETVVLTQPAGERLALEHDGALGLHGVKGAEPLHHYHVGSLLHGTAPERPLVHMVCWEAEPCKLEVSGRVALVGDEKAPIAVKMSHHFANDHHQTLQVEPLDHTLKVSTGLAAPIHHALQMRTPLQVRFCNTWEAASDYQVEVRIGERSLLSLRLKGATTCTPQPCPDDRDCAPVSVTLPGNPMVSA